MNSLSKLMILIRSLVIPVINVLAREYVITISEFYYILVT